MSGMQKSQHNHWDREKMPNKTMWSKRAARVENAWVAPWLSLPPLQEPIWFSLTDQQTRKLATEQETEYCFVQRVMSCCGSKDLSYYFSIELFHSIEKTPPDGVVVSMIFGIENHRYPSHYDLHIKMFHSAE